MTDLFALFGRGAELDSPVPELLSEILRGPDRQARLGAYAYVYANPHAGRVDDLIDAVAGEESRLGQYWGVRALRRSVPADAAGLGETRRRRLEQLVARLPAGTDAASELRQLLDDQPR